MRHIISSIGIIYFFILPVYLPLRTLGIELSSYEHLSTPTDLILYFLQIMLLIGCNSILLSLCHGWLAKRYLIKERLIIHWYRTIAVIFSVFFAASSYFILTPNSLLSLYFWSGAHYFIISFFQILIRSEIHHNRSGITKAGANNYFGLVLNLSAVIALSVFSYFYATHNLKYYGTYCFLLELGFCIYLLFGRRYYVSILKIGNKFSLKVKATFIFLCTLSLLLSSIASLVFVMSGWLGAVSLLAFVIYFYIQLKPEVDKRDLQLIISVSLGYGLILAIVSGSVMTYLIRNYSSNYDVFNIAFSCEPLFSVFIGLVFSYFLMAGKIKTAKNDLDNSLFLLNFCVPVILGFFILSTFMKPSLYYLVIMFGFYAFLEYTSLFYVRQIAQNEDYTDFQAARLTNFHSIILNSLCPSLLYLSILLLTKFTTLELKEQLIVSISGLTVLSIIYNISRNYVMRGVYESY